MTSAELIVPKVPPTLNNSLHPLYLHYSCHIAGSVRGFLGLDPAEIVEILTFNYPHYEVSQPSQYCILPSYIKISSLTFFHFKKINSLKFLNWFYLQYVRQSLSIASFTLRVQHEIRY